MDSNVMERPNYRRKTPSSVIFHTQIPHESDSVTFKK